MYLVPLNYTAKNEQNEMFKESFTTIKKGEINFKYIFHLTRQIQTIIILTYNQHKKLLLNYLHFFFHSKTLECVVYSH